MFRLNSISLYQFKNHPSVKFRFTERLIGICGKNGVGKTNLLDAIYYSCFTKSYFSKSDAQTVLQGAMGFRLEAAFEKNGQTETFVCILRETGKKECLVNDETYTKLSKHIGRFPSVMICPDDIQIITGGSEERRRYLDALVSQLDAIYLQHLIGYTKVLQQRNGYLKGIVDKRHTDAQLLDVYDKQLCEHANYIYQKRKEHLELLLPHIIDNYTYIAGIEENIKLDYESQLHKTSLDVLLKQYREKDILLQRTNCGIHKDDIQIQMGDQPFKQMASQGQRKSLLFAMKLAEWETLAAANGFAPLLLLDDVFEKLDAQRMHNLLQKVCIENDGQVFITDTHPERIKEQFEKTGVAMQVVEL